MVYLNKYIILFCALVLIVVLVPSIPGLILRPEIIYSFAIFAFVLHKIRLDTELIISFSLFMSCTLISNLVQMIEGRNAIPADFFDILRSAIALCVYMIFYTAARVDGLSNAIFKTIVYAGVIASIVAILQQTDIKFAIDYANLFKENIGEGNFDEILLRSTGTFGNPNHLGYFLATALIVAVYNNNECNSVINIFILVIIASGLAITGSRSSIASFLLGFAVLVILSNMGRVYITRLLAALLLCMSAFFSIAKLLDVDIGALFPRFYFMFEEKYIESFDERLQLSSDLLPYAFDRFVLGHGASKINMELGTNVDNEFTLLFYRYGFFGFVSFVLVLASLFFKRLFNFKKLWLEGLSNADSLLISIGAAGAVMTFFGGLYYFDRIFYIMLIISGLLNGSNANCKAYKCIALE